MSRLLLVCLGGAIGTGARYGIALWAPRALGTSFPYGTFIVNVVGSFLIGAVMAFGFSPTTRLFLTTGIMGGFTTYSAFNFETLELLRGGAPLVAAANLVGTVVVCLLSGML